LDVDHGPPATTPTASRRQCSEGRRGPERIRSRRPHRVSRGRWPCRYRDLAGGSVELDFVRHIDIRVEPRQLDVDIHHIDHIDDCPAIGHEPVGFERGDYERGQLMDNTLLWYVARASGLVAWALVSTSVLSGLSLSTRVFGKRPRPGWLLDLHRYLGGTALVFTAIHVVAIVSDTYVPFGLVEVLAPFASTWKPSAVALGIVSLYLLVAIELTSLLRHRLPRKLWRRIHFASFPLFVLATLHLLTAGTDAGNTPLQALVVAVIAAVGGLTTFRCLGGYPLVSRRGAPVSREQARVMELVE
jgi:hypothetical protein